MNQSPKVARTTALLYGVGAVSNGIKDTGFNLFLLFFYTQVAGLSSGLAGTAILCALIIDAVSDPLIGYLSDRSHTRWGRRHPFMYFAAIPMGLGFFYLFTPPDILTETQLFMWMLCFASLTRFAMTFYQVPSTAMVAEISEDYDERTWLSAIRVLAGWLGGLIFATLSYLVFFRASEIFSDGRFDPAAYHEFALTGAIGIVLAILVSSIGTHHLIPILSGRGEAKGSSSGPVRDFGKVIGNQPFMVLTAVIFIAATTIGFTESVSLYMYTYFWGLTPEQLAAITTSAALGALIGFALVPALSKRFDKRPTLAAVIAILAIAYPLIIALRLTGIINPENVDLIFGLLTFNALISVVIAVVMTTLFVSMIADTIDYSELSTGQRQEATFVSAFTFSFKATSGLGGFLTGIFLELVDFPTGAEVPDAIPQGTLESLGVSVAIAIFVAWILATFILRHYTLSRQAHADILAELRRKIETAAPH